MKVELSPEARALVEAGRDADGPDALQRARTRRRLEATLGAAALAGISAMTQSAAAAAGTAKSGVLAKASGLLSQLTAGTKLATAVAVVGTSVAAGVALWPAAPASQPPRDPPARALAVQSDPQAPAALPVERSAQPPADGPSAEELAAPRPRTSTRASRRALRPATPTAPSLQRELALLEAAQDHLRSGAPARALRLLERHAQRFPRGALQQERIGARALALCALGREREGQRLAAELARRAPDSPLTTRVRQACPPASP